MGTCLIDWFFWGRFREHLPYLIQQINSFLGHNLNTTVAVNDNNSKSNYDTNQISQFMKEQLSSNPDLKAKVINAYKNDYDFINSIEFYNDPK